MQPASAQEITVKALALNSPTNKALYTQNGAQIVGTWNFQGQAQGIMAENAVQKDYRITVTLDETKHQYSYDENISTSHSSASVNPVTGDVSAGTSTNLFKGKQFGTTSKEFSLSLFGNKGSSSYAYTFKPDEIKNPLFATLQQSGWQEKKKGILAGLFGR